MKFDLISIVELGGKRYRVHTDEAVGVRLIVGEILQNMIDNTGICREEKRNYADKFQTDVCEIGENDKPIDIHSVYSESYNDKGKAARGHNRIVQTLGKILGIEEKNQTTCKQVKIKLLPGGKMPTKGTEGAAAFDCYAREDITVGEEPVLIGLGFALELPPGYHAKIFPRSSTGLKTSLRQPNSCGIIDSDYRGEVKAMYESKSKMLECKVNKYGNVFNVITGTKPHVIKKGDRIAQMLIERNVDVEFVEVEELSETDRGAGGFGSTGVR
ncbi:dUTP diphosphatase [Phascolarctobacterium faecium]|uniref:dUTP diphosphatase n=1 Tax=Phascolarctobacterium faecium TaxID=33025 RepID=UPI00204EE156|nr:MAG TPA: deoxyuridine 5'-triphosphate nucleotidohydrolase [Caudoviricetes sp.]